jgi:hypothetical protein
MKYPNFLLIIALVITLLFSCKKSGDTAPEPEPEKVTITSVSPAADNLHTGDTVTVTGKYFSTDTSKMTLTFGSRKIPIIAATNETITFTIPSDLTKADGQINFVLDLAVEGKGRTFYNFTIRWREKNGWYYPFTLPIMSNEVDSIFTPIYFPTDSIGFVQRGGWLYRSTDGGITWTWTYEGGSALYSYDGKNSWMASGPRVSTTQTGTSFRYTMQSYRFDLKVIGLYMSSPVNGLVADQNGRLYSVKGSFDSSNVSLKYQTIYYAPPSASSWTAWQFLSAINESNLILAGWARSGSDNYKLIITHEKDGVFNEYDLGPVTNGNFTKALQLIDANTAVLVTRNSDVLKLNGKINWTKLSQKATALYFIDAKTGYAAYNGKILKTTDGGTTWQDEFILRPGETINSICGRNGKIWAVGNDATQGIVLKYNP